MFQVVGYLFFDSEGLVHGLDLPELESPGFAGYFLCSE
jgi:hypothetical protein